MNPGKPPPFSQGKGHDKLNRALAARVSDIVGGGPIQVSRFGDRVVVGFSLAWLLPRIPKPPPRVHFFGKATAAVSGSASTVTLRPISDPDDVASETGDADVTVNLSSAWGLTVPGVGITENQVLSFFYVDTADDGTPRGQLNGTYPMDTSTACP
jgi:hypothetical protein